MSVISRRRRARRTSTLVRVAVLLACAPFVLLPIVWTISSSLKPLDKVFELPIQWIPDPVEWRNYPNAWRTYDFTRATLNSIGVMLAQIAISVSSSTFAGYGFAKFQFRGKERLFGLILSMTLLPLQIIMLPLFLIIQQLGWVSTYQGLILPTAVTAFGVLFMRQFISTIPTEYIHAARIDGASELTILLRIVVPMSTPALITLALLVGLSSWDEFLWPLIVVREQALATLPLAVVAFKAFYDTPTHYLLAVSVAVMLPPLLLFVFGQRRIVASSALTGVKA